jgi:hypothetical protein
MKEITPRVNRLEEKEDSDGNILRKLVLWSTNTPNTTAITHHRTANPPKKDCNKKGSMAITLR